MLPVEIGADLSRLVDLEVAAVELGAQLAEVVAAPAPQGMIATDAAGVQRAAIGDEPPRQRQGGIGAVLEVEHAVAAGHCEYHE